MRLREGEVLDEISDGPVRIFELFPQVALGLEACGVKLGDVFVQIERGQIVRGAWERHRTLGGRCGRYSRSLRSCGT